jgi:hypothetical protein
MKYELGSRGEGNTVTNTVNVVVDGGVCRMVCQGCCFEVILSRVLFSESQSQFNIMHINIKIILQNILRKY